MYIVGELDYLDVPGVLYTNLKLSDPVLAGEHDIFFVPKIWQKEILQETKMLDG